MEGSREERLSRRLDRVEIAGRLEVGSLNLEERNQPAADVAIGGSPSHLLVLHVGDPFECEGALDSKDGFQLKMRSGDMSFLPAGHGFELAWNRPTHVLHASFQDDLVRELLDAHGLARDFDFTAKIQVRDSVLEQLARALLAEVRSGGGFGGGMYVEGLFTALLVQLFRRHSNIEQPLTGQPAPRLGEAALRRALDYMRDNFAAPLTVEDVAQAAHLSPYHFSRLFKDATGFAPHQYLIKIRIERAKELLLNRTNGSLAQLASEVGFFDQAHFTRHFKRIEGVTPAVVRRGGRCSTLKSDTGAAGSAS
jgi:AraC family transcriptional regulator